MKAYHVFNSYYPLRRVKKLDPRFWIFLIPGISIKQEKWTGFHILEVRLEFLFWSITFGIDFMKGKI